MKARLQLVGSERNAKTGRVPPLAMKDAIGLHGVSMTYGSGANAVRALDGVNSSAYLSAHSYRS